MAKHKVDITGVTTNELLVLSNKEMEELFKKRDSDSNARQMLINGNLKLVLSICQRFNNRDENLDDLFQVGCLGLVKAIDNMIEHMEIVINEVPDLVLLSNRLIPKKIEQITQIYDEMKKEKYLIKVLLEDMMLLV